MNQKLIKLRDARQWSKMDLAINAKVSWKTVDKAEQGASIARLSKVKIASALGVEVSSIFPG